jgi:type VI secretion system protein ImpH
MDELLINRIQQLEPDLKVEYILSEMLKSGISAEEIIVIPQGSFGRRYSRDVEVGGMTEFLGSTRAFYNIKCNRDGVYDTLPEGLLHQPQSRKPNKNLKETIEEIKIQKDIENASRRFFLPFEQELYLLKAYLETEERKSIIDNENIVANQVFLDFWELPKSLEDQQLCNLSYLLPNAHLIAGNLYLTRLCFESMLNSETEIRVIPPLEFSYSPKEVLKLNRTLLGVDFILGNSVRDTIPAIEVKIRIENKEELPGYLTGGNKSNLLKFLFNYFIAAEHEVVTVIELKGGEDEFLVSEETEDGRLGFNTWI